MATKITITVENDCVRIDPPPPDGGGDSNSGSGGDINTGGGTGTEDPPAPQLLRTGCAFFRKYTATHADVQDGGLQRAEFKDIIVHTIGIVDNPQINGYAPRHSGYGHNDTTGFLNLSTLNIQPGCLVFVHGEWK